VKVEVYFLAVLKKNNLESEVARADFDIGLCSCTRKLKKPMINTSVTTPAIPNTVFTR
jgi:hypothetical protein